MHMTELNVVGDEPLTKIEKFFAKAPKALDIYENEQAVRRREAAEYDAHEAYMQEQRRDLGDIEIEAASNERLTRPSDKVRERTDRERAKVKAKIAAAQAKRKGYSDSLANHIEEWIAKLMRPVVDANYTSELPSGMTIKQMNDEAAPDKLAQAKVMLKVVKDAPATKELIELQISDSVDAMVGRIPLGAAKKPGGKIEWPTIRTVNGMRGIDEKPDAAGILFNIFADDIKAVLIKRALEGYDESDALTVGGRLEAIKKAEADILEAERFAAYWRRQCLENGIDPGRSMVSNPLALLDIEYA